jgi:hypothetical protein
MPHAIVTFPYRVVVLLAFMACGHLHLFPQGFVNMAPLFQMNQVSYNDPYGSGASFYDFDEDGWDDISFARAQDSVLFFKNYSGWLETIPSLVPGTGETRQVLWADYDNDGDNDLVVTTYNGICRLYRNNGSFTFAEVTEQAGLLMMQAATYGASFGDYDRDGFLDLYVCSYEFEGDPALHYNRLNHLYHNNGDGTFTDVTLAAGVGDGIKMSFQGMWFDYDMDGWQDLFVINDRWFPNTMYRNNGDGTFTDVTASTGLALTLDDPMSISLDDIDHDGDMDIFITNTGGPDNASRLMINNGNGTFTDQAVSYGLDLHAWAWGAAWVDVTNNSLMDLYVTTALYFLASDPNFLMGNVGGSFVHASNLMQGQNNALSFSPVVGDFNNDGYADIAVQNRAPYPPYLWQNLGGTNHYVKITPRGTVSNRAAVGSWVRVYFNGQCRTKYTVCGENYLGQSSQHLIFGLGGSTLVDSVHIQYLSGHTDRYYNLAVDQAYTFMEGETYVAAITPAGPAMLCPGGSIMLDGGDHATWNWNTGHTGRYLTVTTPGAYTVTVTNTAGLQATSAVVVVGTSPDPQITATVTPPSCHGYNDGSIVLQSAAGADLSGTSWFGGFNGASLTALVQATYTYTYMDTHGCGWNANVWVDAPDELMITAETEPASMGNNGSITLAIGGGTPPYGITANGQVVGLEMTGLVPGSYTIEVVDDHLCSTLLVVTVSSTVGIGSNELSQMGVHPNPVHEVLLLSGASPSTVAQLFDSQGRLVQELPAPINGTVYVGHLAPGTYTLVLIQENGSSQARRLLKLP